MSNVFSHALNYTDYVQPRLVGRQREALTQGDLLQGLVGRQRQALDGRRQRHDDATGQHRDRGHEAARRIPRAVLDLG